MIKHFFYRPITSDSPLVLKTAYRSEIIVKSIYPDVTSVTTDAVVNEFIPLSSISSTNGTDVFTRTFNDLFSTGSQDGTDTIVTNSETGKTQFLKRTYIFNLKPDTSDLSLEDFDRIIIPSNINKEYSFQQFNIYLSKARYKTYVQKIPKFSGNVTTDGISNILNYNSKVVNGNEGGFCTMLDSDGNPFIIIGIRKTDFMPQTALDVTEVNALKYYLLSWLQYSENPIKFLFGVLPEYYEITEIEPIILKAWSWESTLSTSPNDKGELYGNYFSEDEELRLVFYSCLSEDNVVDKTKFLENEKVFYGTLRNTCSILYPIIQVKSDEYLHFNYCYIPTFRRWYHVENIVSINKGLWEFTMSVDVLMSHKQEILNQTALVARNEFEWNNMLIDNNIKCEYRPKIINIPVLGFATYKEKSDDSNLANFNYNFTYALSCVGSISLDSDTSVYRYGVGSSFNLLYFLNNPAFLHITSKIADPTYLESLSKMFENPSDSIRYLKLLPFDLNYEFSENLDACNLYGLSQRDVLVGNGLIHLDESDETAFLVLPSYMSPIVLTFCNGHKYIKGETAEEDIDEYTPIKIDRYYNSFLDYAPYTKVEVFLPYIGFVEIDPFLVIGNEFYISYIIDPNSFECDVVLISKDGLPKNPNNRTPWIISPDVAVIWHGNISIDIPLGGNNKNEVYKQLTNIGVQLGTTALGMGTALTFGATSARDVGKQKKRGTSLKSREIWRSAQQEAVETGISGLSNTMVNLINNTPTGYAGNCGNGANSKIYASHMFFRIRRITAEYPENYNHLYGRPLFETKKLSEVHGFTSIENMHLEDFMATNDEKEEIIASLESGVILP